MRISARNYYKVYKAKTLGRYLGEQFHSAAVKRISTQGCEQPSQAERVGGLSRSHAIVRTSQRRENIEGAFMFTAMKERRREDRAALRRSLR